MEMRHPIPAELTQIWSGAPEVLSRGERLTLDIDKAKQGDAVAAHGGAPNPEGPGALRATGVYRTRSDTTGRSRRSMKLLVMLLNAEPGLK